MTAAAKDAVAPTVRPGCQRDEATAGCSTRSHCDRLSSDAAAIDHASSSERRKEGEKDQAKFIGGGVRTHLMPSLASNEPSLLRLHVPRLDRAASRRENGGVEWWRVRGATTSGSESRHQVRFLASRSGRRQEERMASRTSPLVFKRVAGIRTIAESGRFKASSFHFPIIKLLPALITIALPLLVLCWPSRVTVHSSSCKCLGFALRLAAECTILITRTQIPITRGYSVRSKILLLGKFIVYASGSTCQFVSTSVPCANTINWTAPWTTMCVNADYTTPADSVATSEQTGGEAEATLETGGEAAATLEQTGGETEEPTIVAPANEYTEQEAAPQQKCAKIHDFCLGIPFGGLLLSMGLIGFLFWRSPASLTFGVAPGLAILALAVLSLKVWRSGKSSLLFILAQAGIAAAVAWKHGQAYTTTRKLLPWGFYVALRCSFIS
ncbi:Protein FATTY ACID EXPORT 1 chloroplastic [Zea mays]|uniref:Protein FATTY ACID EXPORT 1 chloroplastic n=2 Tax=Zea mays TaxID=4577 RepID=A0A1D6NXR5_MAIZE|nr:Protein FATTY ACID EXPORT 1 chloroplastic [Zea mays]